MPARRKLWSYQALDVRATHGEIKQHPGYRQRHHGPLATLDLSHAAAASSAGALNVYGSLHLGSQNLTIAADYNNANFGSGNDFNNLANVTTRGGQILAAGAEPANMQVITGPEVAGGNTATPTLNVGVIHVRDSTTYQLANLGAAANPSLRGAIQTDVNGGNITGGRATSGISSRR